PEPVAEAVTRGGLVAAAVLSGNRNFEGRINSLVRANYLASPPLVVAYALAGTMDFDPAQDPLGHDTQGKPVVLRDVWPAPGGGRGAATRRGRPVLPGGVGARHRGRRDLAPPAAAGERALRVGSRLQLHQVAAVLRRHASRAGAALRHRRRTRPRAPRRQ